MAYKNSVKEFAFYLGCKEDTVYKAKRHGASKKMAVELERLTGIDRIKFLFPAEYGDPWPEAHNAPIKNI